jgi:hypothetical protein
MIDDLSGIVNVVLFASIIGAAVIYLAAQARKSNHEETVELADTRGNKIDDLEDEIKEMKVSHDAEIQEMRDHMIRLDGQIELLTSQRFEDLAEGIASTVADKVVEKVLTR